MARGSLASAHVSLVVPFPRPVPAGRLAGFVAGHHSVDEGSVLLPDLANAANVQFVLAQPTALNVAERTVTLADGRVMGYDVLSLDTGPVMNRDAIPGARGRALFVRPIEHFAQLWGGLLQLAAERALSVVVLGGDALAVELALALQCRLNTQARVSLVTGGAAPLAERSAAVQQHGRAALKRLGVTVIEDACTDITAAHVVLRGGGRLVCDAPIAAWAPDAPTWLADSGLALDAHGFVLTGPTLQSSSHPAVFAVGELVSRADLSPGQGLNAAQAASTLSTNLRRHVSTGQLMRHSFTSHVVDFVSCADRRAIVSWGDYTAEGRWVWRVKNWLDGRRTARQAA